MIDIEYAVMITLAQVLSYKARSCFESISLQGGLNCSEAKFGTK